METGKLLSLLKRIQNSNPRATIKLVRDNKHAFDRDRLMPNGIDCIDRAIDHAHASHATYDEDSFKRISKSYTLFGSYILFHTALEVLRRDYIHETGIEPFRLVDAKGNYIRPSRINLRNLADETSEAVRKIEEIMDLEEIFDVYVSARLREKGMSDYLDKLIVPHIS